MPSFDPKERAYVAKCREAVAELAELRDLARDTKAPAEHVETLDQFRGALSDGLRARERKTLGMTVAEGARMAGILAVGGAFAGALLGGAGPAAVVGLLGGGTLLTAAGTMASLKLQADRYGLPELQLETLGADAFSVVASYKSRTAELRHQRELRQEVTSMVGALAPKAPDAPAIVAAADEVRIGGITLRVRPDSGGFGLEVAQQPR